MGAIFAENRRRKIVKIIGLYFAVLVALQIVAIIFVFFHEPSFHKGVPVMIFIGTVLPALLALLFARFVKIS